MAEKENYLSNDFSTLIKDIGIGEFLSPNLNESIKAKNNIFDENYQGYSHISSFPSLFSFEYPYSISGTIESNTKDYSNKKRKRDEYYDENIVHSIEKEERKEKRIVKNNNSNEKRGARLKNQTYDTKAGHNKLAADNIIRKIKTAIFSYILEQLNKSLKYTKPFGLSSMWGPRTAAGEFLPLNSEFHKNLKKEDNLKLFDKTIYDIYINEDLNKSHMNTNNSNKTLIKKILEENLEIETIKILKMKFIDILNYIREKDLENFLNKIKDKEEKKEGEKKEEEILEEEESIDKYMEFVKFYIYEYENWFLLRNGRNTSRRQKIKINK